MRSTRFIFWLGLFSLALCSACQKKKHGADESDQKIVVAKIVVRPGSKTDVDLKNLSYEDFFDFQRGILDGAEVKNIAMEKAAGVASGTPPPISIQVARVKGSEVINIIARCVSSDYAKAYTGAMIETYIIKVQGVLQDGSKKEPEAGGFAGLSEAESKLKAAEKALNFFKLEHDAVQMNAEMDALKKRLKQLSVAQTFYESELDFIKRSNLDADVTRRKFPASPPVGMPEEFVRVLGLALTSNEQAYLNAMTKADSVAMAAVKQQAQKDYEARNESHQQQLSAVRALVTDAEKRLGELEAIVAEGKKMEVTLAQARASYERIRSSESQARADALIKSNNPQVSVVVIQKPVLVNAAP